MTLRESVKAAIRHINAEHHIDGYATEFLNGETDLSEWEQEVIADAALSLMQPEIDRRVAEERAKMLAGLREPSDEMCVGLPRDIMMWVDMEPKTPRALFKHLEMIGREIPQWLRDEPEMQHLDHVPSKSTRCAIIWQAMLAQFEKENPDEQG